MRTQIHTLMHLTNLSNKDKNRTYKIKKILKKSFHYVKLYYGYNMYQIDLYINLLVFRFLFRKNPLLFLNSDEVRVPNADSLG